MKQEKLSYQMHLSPEILVDCDRTEDKRQYDVHKTLFQSRVVLYTYLEPPPM